MSRCTNNWKVSCVLPHDYLESYFAEVEAAVGQLPAYTESYVEEILTANRANLRVRLRFQNGALLEINEALVVEIGSLKSLGYRYHFQRADNELVFRYDTTTHRTSPTCLVSHITNINVMQSLPQINLTC